MLVGRLAADRKERRRHGHEIDNFFGELKRRIVYVHG